MISSNYNSKNSSIIVHAESELQKQDWNIFFQERKVYIGMKIPILKPVIVDQEGTPIGSLGELMLITGKPKVGKSRLINIFLSAVLGNESVCNITGYSYEDKNKVVIMDTEQNSYYNYEAFKRIRKMANISDMDGRLLYYSLSRDMPEIRFNAIEKYLELNKDTLLLLIDGVADLCLDINNTNESASISTKLNSLAEQYQVLIITIMHENKNDQNPKGHLGSYLTQKTSIQISIEKPDVDSNVRNVIFKMTRGSLPKDFAFSIDEDGIPILAELKSRKNNAFNTYSLDVIVHRNIINEIFQNHDEYTSATLKDLISLKLEKLDKPHGETIVKSFISRWKEENWITSNKMSTNKLRYTIGNLK